MLIHYFTLHHIKLFALSTDRTRLFQYLEVLPGTFILENLNVHLQSFLLGEEGYLHFSWEG